MSFTETPLKTSKKSWMEEALAEAYQEAKRLAREKKNREANRAKYADFQAKYRDDFAGFVRECISWGKDEGPSDYQEEIAEKISEVDRVSARGPHGLGKTALMAMAVLWFALTRDGTKDKDWKVVTTASAWRQLEKYLWPEIHKWARRLNWEKIGRPPFHRDELLTQKLKLKTGEAFAVASDDPGLIEGAHADEILYIFDESKSVLPATFDAAEGALGTEGAKAIAFSTPGEPSGRFYEIQSRKAGYEDWWVRHVKKDEVIAAGRMTEKWAEARRRQWGEKSSVYLNRVEGKFASADEESVISLALVEKAIERWYEKQDQEYWGDFVTVGVDVARTGQDQTAYALRFGNSIKEIRVTNQEDTMQTSGKTKGIMSRYDGEAIVDTIGIGAGVFDRLREQGLPVVAFTASAKTRFTDMSGEYGFANVRSAAWWNLREMLDDDDLGIALPDIDELIGDLTTPKWRVNSGARISVESKDDIKKRIGRSTNLGDSVIQAFWDGMQATEYGENPLEGYRG